MSHNKMECVWTNIIWELLVEWLNTSLFQEKSSKTVHERKPVESKAQPDHFVQREPNCLHNLKPNGKLETRVSVQPLDPKTLSSTTSELQGYVQAFFKHLHFSQYFYCCSDNM